MNIIKRSSGLTLIEVLVTVVITSIGLMGLLSLQMQAMKATQDAGNRSQSIWIFNDLSNRIRVNEASSSSYAVGGVVCGAIPAPVCSNYFDGGANRIVSDICTGPQLAAWDLFEVACGAPRIAGVRGNPISNLPGTQLSVACVDPAACGDGDPLQITLSWRARIDTTEIDGRIRQAGDNLISQTRTVNP
ncbi:type IV pilus modification protein PilV [Oleispira antarctica]|uniref:Type IV pilus modification protein PilV n=1 Tax=Oleispira antarctica TaxID=188908 RepID=A0A1Y5HLQ0_OLEAN|nr:type IV pilus modification protein PilV [Oleispira antarctica]